MPGASHPYQPIDLSRVKTLPLAGRRNKVSVADFAPASGGAGESFRSFLDRLPRQLAGLELRGLIDAIVRARQSNRPVIWGMGAHVIKCGLSPIVIDLMERGVITAVALNGAGVVHDVEIALIGETSEDVAAGLQEGQFGMAEETGRIVNQAISESRVASHGSRVAGHESRVPNRTPLDSRPATRDSGLGWCIGRKLQELNPPYREQSIFWQAYRLGIPATVHVAIGTDIVHMHPLADGAAIGAASLADFRLLTAIVADLGGGGVYLNVGSAVILPEIFLKALTIARNLGYPVEDFTTANLDMQQHYRPLQNVVRRPTQSVSSGQVDGRGRDYALTGHHEILVPLLAQAVIERLDSAVMSNE